jgi:hypothetical protein
VIALLITLILVVLLWILLRTLFASHPRNVLLVIDVLFLLVAILLIARWAGVF